MNLNERVWRRWGMEEPVSPRGKMLRHGKMLTHHRNWRELVVHHMSWNLQMVHYMSWREHDLADMS